MLIGWLCLLAALFLIGAGLFSGQRQLSGALLMSACVATAFLIVFMWASGLRW
jgi:hypothetical protein